jgi:metal-dependent amidase/aminoacylase/carboxypeptidase family protein
MQSAKKVVGESGFLTIPPFTPSDDVSEFMNRVPGCYMFIGGAMADGTSGMHHSPTSTLTMARVEFWPVSSHRVRSTSLSCRRAWPRP